MKRLAFGIVFLYGIVLFWGCNAPKPDNENQPAPPQQETDTSSVVLPPMIKDFVKDATASIELKNIYNEESDGFRFKFPADWKKTDLKFMGIPIAVVGPPVDDFSPNVNIVIQPRDDKLTTYTKKDMLEMYSIIFRDIDVKSFDIQKFNGTDAIYVHYTCKSGEKLLLEVKQYLFNLGDNNLVLTFTDTQKHFQESAPVFESIVGSFEFK